MTLSSTSSSKSVYFRAFWPVLILLLGLGISATLGTSLAQRSEKIWVERANQEASQQSMTLLSWIEESYSMLSGLMALIDNSNNVEPEEFLNAVDGMETRAEVNLVSVKAILENGIDGWHIKYSSAPRGADPVYPQQQTAILPMLQSTLDYALEAPNEWVISPPFNDRNNQKHVYVVLASVYKSDLAIAGVLNIEQMVDSLSKSNSRKSVV